jgi:endopeptidase La
MATKKEVNLNKLNLIEKKICFFQDVIQKTFNHIHYNRQLDIFGFMDIKKCVSCLEKINEIINKVSKYLEEPNNNTDIEITINNLQKINNELSLLFKLYGTYSFEDFLWICSGNSCISNYSISELEKGKYNLLKKYFHPIGYRILEQDDEKSIDNTSDDSIEIKVNNDTNKKKEKKLSQIHSILNEKSKNLDCCDIELKKKNFNLRVYGIDVIIHNIQQKKSLIVSGIIEDIPLTLLTNKFIENKKTMLMNNIPESSIFQTESFQRYIKSITLKDYLLFEHQEIYTRYAGFVSYVKNIKLKSLEQLVKDFLHYDLFNKRNMIIKLLYNSEQHDNLYMAYLLYDLLTNDNNGKIDTTEQIQIFNSFSFEIKQYFTEAINKTKQYTNDITNFDIQKIPLEQQICLLKTNESIKEKAMQKLKEIKAKSEDSGSKARQYLDGLLKIPFGVYKKEPILHIMDEIRILYGDFLKIENINKTINDINKVTSLEIIHNIRNFKKSSNESNNNELINKVNSYDKKMLIFLCSKINEYYKKQMNTSMLQLNINNKPKKILTEHILKFIELNSSNSNDLKEIFNIEENNIEYKENIYLKNIEKKYNEINKYMNDVKKCLDKSIYGHNKAKNQVEMIIGQWINGKQEGYCFGFEGPAGVGKTTLAKKGLAECLKDENGISRPFAMIQMGGDSNGSSLHGHNYTYVGSTWGSIVQILIDKKCMNPIIFIDEIDKISKTEHGKEIVGILIHLLDSTQNDCFQDKYFSGIDLDLSKALFILSYNDVDAIDKILLDRIHRIKFNNLTLEEKLVICKTYILPEVFEKMGLTDVIKIDDDVLLFIIDEYTYEPGVRKLKEILFEIVGEINLDILKNFDTNYSLPINVTIHEIKNKYFKDKSQVKTKKIHNSEKIGIINGLWANSQGKGGVIPIQCNWRPSDKFLNLFLTGLQGDVMKESMNVALTLAWNLTPYNIQEYLLTKHSLDGIHIHCPEGATPKDGPSAGTAITTTIWSLLNDRLIRPNIAITGEITLDGEVTEIGGLDLKILGGIKAGVTEFIFPLENKKDYEMFYEKYKDDKIIEGIKYHMVSRIEDVFKIIFS